jgi:hypothetical protein
VRSPGRFGSAPLVAAAALGFAVALACGAAFASVRRTGSWPAIDHELVSFSAEHLPRAEAIRRLADKAGWGVVVQGAASGTVDVQVTRQPAAKVLELILGDGSYLAKRDGNLVSIAPVAVNSDGDGLGEAQGNDGDGDNDGDNDGDAAAATSAAQRGPGSAAPALTGAKGEARPRGKDRVVLGDNLTIGRDEVVGDLVVMGGSAEVLGHVSGDVSVFGGSLHVREGGHVFGDVATFGGSVSLAQGSRVDGDLSVLGGSVDRNDKAIVGGHSKGGGQHEEGDEAERPTQARHSLSFQSAAGTVGGAITRTALLFAFGAVLWALAGRRVERLQDEVAARPMRSFAIGVVGMIAAALALVVLCVTVIGIPIALVAALVSVFGAYAGVCAALSTAGALLVRHRTSSPYVHLALGCAAYLLLSSIPFVGQFVTAAVALIGFGALVATRGAGLIRRRRIAAGGEAA